MARPTLAQLLLVLLAGIAASMCSGSTATTTSPSASTSVSGSVPPTTLPTAYARFGGSATVSLDGSSVVIRTTDVPDHTSPYFGSGNAGYEAPQAGMQVNQNRIA